MDILKTATDWTKAEMYSSVFFIVFGVLFVAAGVGFWQLGKTEIARAYAIPTCIAGTLLLIIGLGIFFPSMARITHFPALYDADPSVFIADQIERAGMILGQYHIAIFRVIPIVVALCAILMPIMATPVWRAGTIVTIAMMAVILMIDTNANARLEIYRAELWRAR